MNLWVDSVRELFLRNLKVKTRLKILHPNSSKIFLSRFGLQILQKRVDEQSKREKVQQKITIYALFMFLMENVSKIGSRVLYCVFFVLFRHHANVKNGNP